MRFNGFSAGGLHNFFGLNHSVICEEGKPFKTVSRFFRAAHHRSKARCE
jgi:hypothetical protein